MIKRLSALLLAMLYTVTVFGFALNLHYCGNLLTSVEINAPSKVCSKWAAKMKCCHDKHLQVKVKDAHQSAAFVFQSKNFSFTTQPVIFCYNISNHYPVITRSDLNKAPPDIPRNATPIYLKDLSLRI